MSYLCKIKLGGVNNLSDARYAAAAGIDYIGFCFDPTQPEYIPPIRAREIIDWTSGSSITGEFGRQSVEEIMNIAGLLNLDIIELHNDLLPDELPAFGKPVIKQLNAQHSFEQMRAAITAYAPYADAFLLPAGAVLSNAQLKTLCAANNIIIACPNPDAQVTELVKQVSPFAIELRGSDEEQTGMKDYEQINELLDTIVVE